MSTVYLYYTIIPVMVVWYMVYGINCVFVVMLLCLSPNYADNRLFQHFAEVPEVLLPLLK